MLSLFFRGATKSGNEAGQIRPTVAQAVANSGVIDISRWGWGGVKFTVNPGTVTVYARMDKDDDFATIGDPEDGNNDVTFQPGVKSYPLPDILFYFNEIKFISTNDITGTAGSCRCSFKS